ncbi:MAG: hypothetical protein GY822_03840, partial [Deltaproteobacteria bacterium]|nr:hypothetical protein [Deltaproteobacteria bacterium]
MKTKKIPAELEEMLEEGIIDDVLARLLSGKEASLFVVQKGEDIIAAKVYKSRKQRSFKNIVSYIDGRNQTRNSRDRRAQSKKTNYGRELVENNWRQMEFDSLYKAFSAGVRCPEPILMSGDVLLMELLMDEFGEPALRLADMELDDTVAKLLHQEIFQQVRLLLTCDLIHGDLSAYNILVAHNGLNLIDLPQAVDASANNEARDILARDLRNITEFLSRFDAALLDFTECGNALFSHYEKGTLSAAVEPQRNPKRAPSRKINNSSIDESLYAIREAKEHNDRKHGRGPPRSSYGDDDGKENSGRGDFGHGARDDQRRHNRDQRGERNVSRDHRGRSDRGPPQNDNRGPRQDNRGYGRDDNRGPRQDNRGRYDNRGPRQDNRGRDDNRGPRQDNRGRDDNRGPRQDNRGRDDNR